MRNLLLLEVSEPENRDAPMPFFDTIKIAIAFPLTDRKFLVVFNKQLISQLSLQKTSMPGSA